MPMNGFAGFSDRVTKMKRLRGARNQSRFERKKVNVVDRPRLRVPG